jgi:hypothetical protein
MNIHDPTIVGNRLVRFTPLVILMAGNTWAFFNLSSDQFQRVGSLIVVFAILTIGQFIAKSNFAMANLIEERTGDRRLRNRRSWLEDALEDRVKWMIRIEVI